MRRSTSTDVVRRVPDETPRLQTMFVSSPHKPRRLRIFDPVRVARRRAEGLDLVDPTDGAFTHSRNRIDRYAVSADSLHVGPEGHLQYDLRSRSARMAATGLGLQKTTHYDTPCTAAPDTAQRLRVAGTPSPATPTPGRPAASSAHHRGGQPPLALRDDDTTDTAAAAGVTLGASSASDGPPPTDPRLVARQTPESDEKRASSAAGADKRLRQTRATAEHSIHLRDSLRHVAESLDRVLSNAQPATATSPNQIVAAKQRHRPLSAKGRPQPATLASSSDTTAVAAASGDPKPASSSSSAGRPRPASAGPFRHAAPIPTVDAAASWAVALPTERPPSAGAGVTGFIRARDHLHRHRVAALSTATSRVQ